MLHRFVTVRATSSLMCASLLACFSLSVSAQEAASAPPAQLADSQLPAAQFSASQLSASQAALRFARAYTQLVAPAVDDPDAVGLAALKAVGELREHGYAAMLVDRLRGQRSELQRPAELLAATEELLAAGELHGLVALQLGWYRYRLLHAAGNVDAMAAADPGKSGATSFVCVGPFAPGEDLYQGVAFAPELAEWPADAGFAQAAREPRFVRVGSGSSQLNPVDPGTAQQGCFYALHRVACDQATQCYVALWTRGVVEMFVNGERFALLDASNGDGRTEWLLPIGLNAGTNHVVVKTCSSSAATFEMSFVDGRRRALTETVREVPAETPIAAPPAPLAATLPAYVDRYQEFGRDASGLGDEHRALVAVVKGLLADRMALRDEQLVHTEDQAVQPGSIADASTLLAAAYLWRQQELMPVELRNARARAFAEKAAEQLVDADGVTEHWAMLRARVRLLEEQDNREAALEALFAAVEAKRAGPGAFRLLLAVAARAEFAAERPRILAAWADALPTDAAVFGEMSRDCYAASAMDRAAELGAKAVRMRPDESKYLRYAFPPLLVRGRRDEALALCDLVMPTAIRSPEEGTVPRLWRMSIARDQADTAVWLEVVDALLADPKTASDRLRSTAHRLQARGFRDRAAKAYELLLKRSSDDFGAIRGRARLLGQAGRDATFARFRADGDALIAALADSQHEHDAPATTLIEQRIVEVFADGSQLVEVHELRRLNDPSAIEAYGAAADVAEADAVLLLRTIDAEGREYVPVKVDGSYAMPRLEPGVFVEWRYQNRVPAPDSGAPDVDWFLFGSFADDLLRTELVLIQAPQEERIAGFEIRSRGFDVPTEVVALEDGREARRWTRENAESLKNDKMLPSMAFMVPVVQAGRDGSMHSTLRVTAQRLATITRTTSPIRRQADELLAGIDDAEQQLAAIYDWCQREITPGRSRSATETLLKKQGNRMALILTMLKHAGFSLESAMGESILPELFDGYPSLFESPAYRFDAWCVRVMGKGVEPVWLFFDAARYEPLRWISPQRAGGEALVWTDQGVEIAHYPASNEHGQHIVIEGSGTVGAERVEVEARITMRGNDAWRAAEHFLRQPAAAGRQFARQFGQQVFAGWQVKDAKLLKLEPGRPVAVQVQVRRRSLQQSGAESMLPIPLVPTRFQAGFGPAPDRTREMRITTDVHFAWDLALELDGVQLLRLPEPVAFTRNNVSFLQTARLVDGKLVLRRRATVTPATIPVRELGDWASALQRIEEQDQQSIPCRVR
ncbi:MAG: hypothetical protein AB8H80_08350 [Planctomycetota bacterium]